VTVVEVAVRNNGPDVFTGSQIVTCTGEGILRPGVTCTQGGNCPQEHTVDIVGEWPAFSMEINTYYWSFNPKSLFDAELYNYEVVCTVSGSNDPNLDNNSSPFQNP
jgi:hypothetical protein